jgi:hypothetical protein
MTTCIPQTGSIAVPLGVAFSFMEESLRRTHASALARILHTVSDRSTHPRSDRTPDDRKLLMQRPVADTSFLESDAWRALRIMGEFIEGFDALARLGPAVSIFGSARTKPDEPMYERAQELAAKLSDRGFTVITGGQPWRQGS